MNDIVQCSNCGRKIDLDKDAQTRCSECKKHFCFCLTSRCFVEYHVRNDKNLSSKQHTALSISNPQWKVNLISTQRKELIKEPNETPGI